MFGFLRKMSLSGLALMLLMAGAVSNVNAQPEQERIAVTFEEPEQDILTKQAIEKLDVIVESLEFSNADLRNVIRIIGERLDINFIFDAENIDGQVTLRLRNVRLRDALDSILTTRRLAIVPDRSGIFRIVPEEFVGRSGPETRTEVIQLNWINASDVAETLEPFVSEDGTIQANEESNAVIVTDVPPAIQEIKELISQIDMAERQVAIEARLADVNTAALRTLGTDWSVAKDARAPVNVSTAGAYDPLSVASILHDGLSVMPATGGVMALGDTISVFDKDFDLNMAFSFFEDRGVVEILANPRVTTLNNVPANIEIIERIPYIEAVQGPSGNSVTAEVEFTDAGIRINVLPIVTPNDYVRLEVQLEQMIFRERVGGDALDPPAIDYRNANTNVIVADGNTVVLGGLRQQRKLEGEATVPWLGRIPMFGWLFKNKNYDQSKLELVLMMTPTIIQDTITINDREKFWYDKIDEDWHLPDWFFDDVKNVHDK